MVAGGPDQTGTFREFCPDIYGPSYQNTAILSVKYSGYTKIYSFNRNFTPMILIKKI